MPRSLRHRTEFPSPQLAALYVIRGDGWLNEPIGLRSAYSYGIYPVSRTNHTGLRMCREAS